MTTEEKARAYDEALKCAKMYYKENKDYNAGFLPIIFPELAESEDERIRKAIVGLIEELQRSEKNFAGVELTDMLAYLEKQKEPHFTKRNALFDKCVENCDPTVMKKVSDEVDGMLEKEQKEQKPVKWTEDFENNIRKLLHDKLIWHSDDGSMSSAVFIDDKTIKDIVTGIWFYVGKEAMKNPNMELPKQEWSGEDEEMRNLAIEWAEIMSDKFSFVDMDPTDFRKIISWLKSLRPQPKHGRSKDIKQTTKNTHPEEYPSSFAECISPREYSLFKQLQQDCIETIEQELYSLGKEHEKDHDPRIKFLKSLKPSWRPSAQELGALKTAVSVLTEERTFPKAAAQIQKIIDVFDGKKLRKDWKPSGEQMEVLFWCKPLFCDPTSKKILESLINDLNKLM